eukprot:3137902-Prymnesium_polylepis.1
MAALFPERVPSSRRVPPGGPAAGDDQHERPRHPAAQAPLPANPRADEPARDEAAPCGPRAARRLPATQVAQATLPHQGAARVGAARSASRRTRGTRGSNSSG